MKTFFILFCAGIALLNTSCAKSKPSIVDHDFKLTTEPKIVHFETKDMPDLCIIGKDTIVKRDEPNPGPAFWDECFRDAAFRSLPGTLSENIYSRSIAVYRLAFEDYFILTIGYLMHSDTNAPDGFVKYGIKNGTVGIGWMQGSVSEMWKDFPRDDVAHRLTVNSARDNGYTFDDSRNFHGIEVYDPIRHERGEITIVDYYIPIRRQ